MPMHNCKSTLKTGASVVALSVALAVSSAASAGSLPAHGHFVSGEGSINKANRSLTVKQSSTTGIIDWKSFSVGKHSGVTFDNGSGATLNRVTGGNLSTIAGSLHASGTLYLMNSSGVIVSGTGWVVTGGSFVASSGNITNSAFKNDKLHIKNGHAAVINYGSITAAGGVRLVGDDVSNTGSISASRVKFWARHQLAIGGEVTAQKGKVGGNVIAEGHAIDVSGRIEASATAAHKKGGTIVIDARGGTTVSGELVAKGGRHGIGGFVETSGEHVHIADSAHISTLASHGQTGTWLIDPVDFVIAASGGDVTGAELSQELSSTSEDIKSGGGGGGDQGEVIVDDNVTWSSSSTLTLDASADININATIKITGAGGLVLVYGDTSQTGDGSNAGNGDLVFNGGRVAFADVTSGNNTALSIEGINYMLENSISDLAAALINGAGGDYALANNYDASGDNGGAGYTGPVIGTVTGTVEGLGNTISDLTIDEPTGNEVGLFEANAQQGTIRDIRVTNANITGGAGSSGVLVADNEGTIKGAFVSGTINGSSAVGGLAGVNFGAILNSSASVAVSGTGSNSEAGGLVGFDNGTISSSYATGSVTLSGTNSKAGGLVGDSDSTIENSYATGAVTGGGSVVVGGLVGYSNGTVSASYATGDVTGGAGAAIGGLLGENSGDGVGTLRGSYASGNVTATGGQGALVGGLVGYNANGAHITDSYAMGNVSAPSGASVDMGGLVGENVSPGTIDESYELGAVTGGSGAVGALIGDNSGSAGVTTALYYNSTANPTLAAVGFGTLTNGGGLPRSAMETTASFQGWNFNTSIGGSGFVIVDQDGTFNNDGYDHAGATTPIALAEFSTTITNAHQLQLMVLEPTWDYVLTNNIDASGTSGNDVWGSQGFIAIGLNNSPGHFTGTFDGQNHTISGLFIDEAYSNGVVGLFAYVDTGGVVRNVGLIDGSVSTPFGVEQVGLLAGFNDGTITSSFATGTVSTDTADSYVGGLVGRNVGTIQASYAYATVSDQTQSLVGGLVGFNQGTIETSYATGAVSVGDSGSGGGLVGKNTQTIQDSYAAGNVTGGNSGNLGGFIGDNAGTITHAYETGNVSGGNETTIGGFVGANESGGTIDESYSLGAITFGSSSTNGGFAGKNSNASGISASVGDYFNSTAVAGGGIGNDADGGGSDVTGLTLADMHDKSNFSGWTDFGTIPDGSGWVIVDQDATLNNASGATGGTTPMLLSEYATTITNAQQLQLMELDLTANYTLANDISASGTAGGDVWGSQGFIPVGGADVGSDNFTGNFDGAYHTISNLFINDSTNLSVGLFGTNAGSISNLNLSNASVSMTGVVDVLSLELGALAGGNSGNIDNVTVSGTVSASNILYAPDGVGGLVGANVDGTITSSGSSAHVSLSGSDTADYHAGGLAGLNTRGTISESYSTGSVTVEAVQATAGGLVGLSDQGTISQSWSSAAVAATSTGSGTGSLSSAGGLVGSTIQGTVSQSYAMGTATANGGAASMAGGLVGDNEGTITQSYAIGVVTGGAGAQLGGLVGLDSASPGSITSSYFDTQTSGINATQGAGNIASDSGITGLTTSAFQSQTLTQLGFDSTVWGTGNGLYPYLLWQYPTGTPQAVSGFAHSDAGAIALSGGSVSLLIGGNAGGTATTGANGYYYFLEAPGAISSTSVLTYLSGIGGASFADNVTGSVSGLNIDNSTLNETTAGSSYAALASDLTTAISGNSAVQTLVSGLANLGIDYTGNTAFTIDSAINRSSGTLSIRGSGGINQTAAIQAGKLLLLGAADYTLNNAGNAIAIVAGHTTGSLNLTSDEALTVGSVDGTNGLYIGGGATLATASGGIAITQQLTADTHPLTLISAGAITESGSGAIDAKSLTGSSASTTTLNGANVITDLGTFTSGSTFELTDAHDLTVDGAVNAGFHTVELKTTGSGHDINLDAKVEGGTLDLISAATITENSSGDIDATKLEGSSASTAEITSAKNTITDLGTFTSGSTFELTDDHDLTVDGTVKASGHAAELTTKGFDHDINLDAKMEAGTLDLISAATITENSSGDIDATKLEGSSTSTAEMNSVKNTITDLGTFTSGGTFELTDDHALKVDGTVNAGSHTLKLTTAGKNHNLLIAAKIEGGTVDLATTGEATESSAGAIDAKLLNVTANTGIKLTSKKNDIKKLGTHKTKKGPNKVTL